MSRLPCPVGLVVMALVAPLPVSAEESPCLVAVESAQTCWRRLTQHPGDPAPAAEPTSEEKEAVAAEGKKDLASRTTGTRALEGLAASTTDFIAPFAAALGVAPTTSESGDAAFEKSFHLPIGGTPQKVKLQALLRRPTVYAPLREALAEDTREVRAAVLEKGLGDFDDVRLAAAWNLENRSFGRRFGPNERKLYVGYFEQIFRANAASASVRAQLQALAAAVSRNTGAEVDSKRVSDERCEGAAEDPVSVPLFCLSAPLRRDLMDVIGEAADAVGTREVRLREAFAAGGLHRFTDLLDNQPQLSVEWTADLRDDLVGPNEWAASVRYELGFSNLNGLRDHCRVQGLAETDPSCLKDYLDQPGVAQSLDRGDRLFFSAEFKKRESYDAVLPDDPVHLSLERTWDFVGRFGLGRYLARGARESRLDLAGEYVYHRDDPNRQNRFVASATYTQRISDTLSLAAGFNYSSRPEFLSGVDKKVSARFGLRYKIVN